MKNFTKAQKRLFLAHELFTKVDVTFKKTKQ